MQFALDTHHEPRLIAARRLRLTVGSPSALTMSGLCPPADRRVRPGTTSLQSVSGMMKTGRLRRDRISEETWARSKKQVPSHLQFRSKYFRWNFPRSPTGVLSMRLLAVAVPFLLASCGGDRAIEPPTEASPPMTIRVPADQPTIAAAIAAASDGFTVLLAPGVYSGSGNRDLDFAGKRLMLRGADDPSTVIVDCEGQARFLAFESGEDERSGFRGLTVRNCSVDFRGAVYLRSTSPTIEGNIFESTMVTDGASIFGFNGSPVIQRNVFKNTRCDDQFISGVVCFVNNASPYIANNLFVGNQCRSVSMTLADSASPVVVNNTFVANRAGIYIDRTVNTSSHWYANNLMSGNERGVQVVFETQPRIDPLAAVFQFNLVHGNAADYLGTADLTGQAGNLRADPQLVAPPTDLRLTASSPARGSGTALRAPPDDFGGAPRVAPIDIGAHQFR